MDYSFYSTIVHGEPHGNLTQHPHSNSLSPHLTIEPPISASLRTLKIIEKQIRNLTTALRVGHANHLATNVNVTWLI